MEQQRQQQQQQLGMMRRRSVTRVGRIESSKRPILRVERRVRALRRLVPGGKHLQLDGLLREAADYVTGLRMQVMVMKRLVEMLSHDS
ncbi:Myc-type basic helix-loop-helix (bHLH) domain-containing protein [Dioscorea alata]|uniref:Myc-type basic helix-loop-helix (BHLH) domain-containing protein n=1 Tax=Dioscorea alata TaxID=55571 RepID=A0ACB7VP82_DIOAL|nr:Myc-type basic helix-loop-helix (bHLH) domain-containing protein [Dioscorea alata]